MKPKWIVVIVNAYYPTVYHFDNEEDARKEYDICIGSGFATHLAEVKECSINEQELKGYGRDARDVKGLDVEW